MAVVNPFNPVSSVTRAKYFESEGKWEQVTESHRYQDGGVSFNEASNTTQKIWQITWTGLTEAEADAIDLFFESVGYHGTFSFLARDATVYSGCRFRDGTYTKQHQKQFSQTRIMEIVYDEYVVAVSQDVTANAGADLVTANAGADQVVYT